MRHLILVAVAYATLPVLAATAPTVPEFMAMTEQERTQALAQLDATEVDRFTDALDQAMDELALRTDIQRQHAQDAMAAMVQADSAGWNRGLSTDGPGPATVRDLLTLSDRDRRGYLAQLDPKTLDSVAHTIEGAFDEATVAVLGWQDSLLASEKSTIQAQRAWRGVFGDSVDGPVPHFAHQHLVGCQFGCNSKQISCTATSTFSACQQHVEDSYDCREGDMACALDRADNLAGCGRQFANNLQRCANSWSGCHACCANIDPGDSATHDFEHCDDGFDAVELDNSLR